MKNTLRKIALSLIAITLSLLGGAIEFDAYVFSTNKVGLVDVAYKWHYICDTDSETAVLKGVTPHPYGDITIPSIIADVYNVYAVKEIGEAVFANAQALTKVEIPNTIERIGDYAFSNCTALAEVAISEGVRSIGKRPFVNTALKEINLPATLLEMDGNIAAGTIYTATINIGDSSHFVYSDEGVLYNRDMTKLYACPVRAEGTITIASSVTNIVTDAFFGCFRLSYLNLPDLVNTIGSGAFNVNGIWPGLQAPESIAKLSKVYYNGNAPKAESDIYAGAPANLVSYANESTKGWPSSNRWCERTLIIGTEGKTTEWEFDIVDDEARIKKAAVATGTVTIPVQLGGYPVTDIAEDAFNACSGITAFATDNSAFSVRNGCLYSADGTTLIRVPDSYDFDCTATIKKTTTTTITRTIPGLNSDGTDNTKTTVTVKGPITTTTTERLPGTANFDVILKNVRMIRGFAFWGCNSFTNSSSTTTNKAEGVTGFLTDGNGNIRVYVETSQAVVETSSTYTTPFPAHLNINIDKNAFAGTSIKMTSSPSGGNAGHDAVIAVDLAPRTSYIGWTEASDGNGIAGTVSLKTSSYLRNGTMRLSGYYTPLGGKKIRLTTLEQIASLPNLTLVKDLSKSTVAAEKAVFDRFKGKLWTVAFSADTKTYEPLFGGFSGIALSARTRGKIKVTGFLADGTRVSTSCQMVKIGEQYFIPVLAQLYSGKLGGFSALVKIDGDGRIVKFDVGRLTAKTADGWRTIDLESAAFGTAAATPGAVLSLDYALADDGFSFEAANSSWRPRYSPRTGLISGSVYLYNENGRRIRATVNAVNVNGTGLGAATIKKTASYKAHISN